MAKARATSLLVGPLLMLTLVPGLLGSAASRAQTVELVLDRLTYVDGAYRVGPETEFVWLGFDAARSSESLGVDVPGTRTSVMIVPGAVPEHFESVTVDLRHAGDLTVEMIGRHTGTANPRAVPDSANHGGVSKGRSVLWRMPQAEPGTYSFTARFKPRSFEPSLSTFMPESRITLASSTQIDRLVLAQHAAPAYGPPVITSGGLYGPTKAVGRPDEWVATPSYVAQGNYHWATGRVGEVGESPLSALIPAAGDVFNSGSMGYGTTTPMTGPKVIPFMDFTYGPRFAITGFLYGLVTADALGEFIPFGTSAAGGAIYDGDAGMFAIGMSVASVHGRDKRPPDNDRGELRWDWDGAWAEGWSTKDEHTAPGTDRVAIEPVLSKESVFYARSFGGDIDNREGSKRVKGPRWILELPDHGFGFISHGASYPSKSEYRTESGFTKSGSFFMRPTIRPGGYMLEGRTDGYFRDWQAAELLSVSLFDARPEEEPGVRRIFTFPAGMEAEIVAATTTGMIERSEVGPGTWELIASPGGFEIRRLQLRGA